MQIRFGLAFDEELLPGPPASGGGVQYAGPSGLLYFLESCLGLLGPPANNEYLRIEQYRQLLKVHLEQHPTVFFRASFEADQLATAEALLQRRDELLLAGWNFVPNGAQRLDCMAHLEASLKEGEYQLEPGYADRFAAVLKYLPLRSAGLEKVWVHEPQEILPRHFQRLFDQLSQKGVLLEYLPEPLVGGSSDLGLFQQSLQRKITEKQQLKADGSLLIIRGKRETSLATFFAQLLQENEDYRPACLISEKNNTLDHALTLHGLPSLGMLSASLARPTLQVLKLVTVFLWEPVDPFKIMEFVSLSVKPLDRELANRIAGQIAQTPGLGSDSWRATIARFFNDLRERIEKGASINLEKIENQYNFWFNRKRHPLSSTVPKEEAVSIFAYLANWAYECFEDKEQKNTSLLVLAEQSKRVKTLLEALPEGQLSHLELERIVRTIYEPAPVQLRERQLGCLPYALTPGGIHDAVDQLVWWNFNQAEPQHFFSRWYGNERGRLAEQGIHLENPEDENARLLWHRKQPFLRATGRLLLFIPEMINGQHTEHHPLYGDLQATFGNLQEITLDISNLQQAPAAFSKWWKLPGQITMEARQLGRPSPFIKIPGLYSIEKREKESFSSLRDLFYYPYQWVFKHKVQLRKSSILSVVKDKTLMGNLAHRMFERLLSQEGVHQWTKEEVMAFIDAQKNDLFSKEGAVMLMYGKEPERVGFIRRLKLSAWSLVRHIRENGWVVERIEAPIQSSFAGCSLNGRADLILKRGEQRAVIDLKWRGARYREEMIKNEEDLQLVLYAYMMGEGLEWAETAYFIMEKGVMLARHNRAFQDVNPISPEADLAEVNQRILARMKATYEWRMEQISRGLVEVRCEQTEQQLEEHYSEDNLFDLLEMKAGDAPFDDYRTLINLTGNE
jgi:RecB family exonuclease